jgi:XkdN-like tail assembly chaperone
MTAEPTPDLSRRPTVSIGELATAQPHSAPTPAKAIDFDQGRVVGTDDDRPDDAEEELTEAEIIRGLISAGVARDTVTRTMNIRRRINGVDKLFFRFAIHALDDDTSEQALIRASNVVKGARGVETITKTRYTEMRSRLIYEATVGEKGSKVWDNKEAQKARGALNAYELIDKTLNGVEKGMILEHIEEMSGGNTSLVDPLSD